MDYSQSTLEDGRAPWIPTAWKLQIQSSQSYWWTCWWCTLDLQLSVLRSRRSRYSRDVQGKVEPKFEKSTIFIFSKTSRWVYHLQYIGLRRLTLCRFLYNPTKKHLLKFWISTINTQNGVKRLFYPLNYGAKGRKINLCGLRHPAPWRERATFAACEHP